VAIYRGNVIKIELEHFNSLIWNIKNLMLLFYNYINNNCIKWLQRWLPIFSLDEISLSLQYKIMQWWTRIEILAKKC